MSHLWKIALVAVTLCFVAATRAAGPDDQPATSQPVLLDVSDKAGIDAAMGKDVELEGIVSSAQWSTSGKVLLIKFEKTEESKVMAAVFEKKREAMDKSFAGDVGKGATGAHVRIKGTLKEFKGHPEVIVDMPSQITILEPGPTTKPS